MKRPGRYGRNAALIAVIFGIVAGASSVFLPGISAQKTAPRATQGDWLTWGYDQERTGWNKSETTLTKENVSGLQLKWKSQLSTKPVDVVLSTLTAPVIAAINGAHGPETVAYIVGSDNTVFALDSETGEVIWQKKIPNTLTAPAETNSVLYQCPDTQNATPVIDKDAGIIYLTTSDGKLRGLSLTSGEEQVPSVAFTDPFARNWSLNLIDGVIYSATARGCGGSMAHFTATDVRDSAHRTVELYSSGGRPSGSWGRGGLVRGPKGVYAQTADGPYDPAAGNFGETLMALSLKDLRVVGSYTPANWDYLNNKDLDLGSTSPVVFPFQKTTLIASVGKESVVYLLDVNNLGGTDHHTPLYQSPRFANDEALLHDRGIWGAMATWQDEQGQRWLVMPMMGPPSNELPPTKYSYGDVKLGAILAARVESDPTKGTPMLTPIWISRDMHAPDPPVIANGVVYALQTGRDATEARTPAKPGKTVGTNAILYALDAESGKELFSSANVMDSWAHFSEPVVVGGNVYVCTWDGKVYAFGLKNSH